VRNEPRPAGYLAGLLIGNGRSTWCQRQLLGRRQIIAKIGWPTRIHAGRVCYCTAVGINVGVSSDVVWHLMRGSRKLPSRSATIRCEESALLRLQRLGVKCGRRICTEGREALKMNREPALPLAITRNQGESSHRAAIVICAASVW
jgi:hypothetical protein